MVVHTAGKQGIHQMNAPRLLVIVVLNLAESKSQEIIQVMYIAVFFLELSNLVISGCHLCLLFLFTALLVWVWGGTLILFSQYCAGQIPCESCGASCPIRTANTDHNRGRKFYSCQNHDCGFFVYVLDLFLWLFYGLFAFENMCIRYGHCWFS